MNEQSEKRGIGRWLYDHGDKIVIALISALFVIVGGVWGAYWDHESLISRVGFRVDALEQGELPGNLCARIRECPCAIEFAESLRKTNEHMAGGDYVRKQVADNTRELRELRTWIMNNYGHGQ